MSLTRETLSEQLKASENELEMAKAHVYRLDGVVQMLKHLVEQFDEEKPLDASEDAKQREPEAHDQSAGKRKKSGVARKA